MAYRHWQRRTHQILTEIAARKMELPDPAVGILKAHTLEPDSWTLLQMPAHYLPFSAHIAAHAANDAKRMLARYSDPRIGYQRLAIAMHFMADCASPFHTCLFDFKAQRYHRQYEEYVARNMLRGHCFSQMLLGSPRHGIFPEYARDLAAGAYHIGGLAHASLGVILKQIRTDPVWEKRRDVAGITADHLLDALRMCQTQIHAVVTHVHDSGLRCPVQDPLISYHNPLGALLFYRTHVGTLIQQRRAGNDGGV